MQNWLYNQRFEYKNICKYIFIDRHECLLMLEDQNNFLRKIEDLKPYMVECEENSKIKPKLYSFDCTIGSNDWQPIILIIYNKCTFFANNSIQITWTQFRDILLQLKGYK